MNKEEFIKKIKEIKTNVPNEEFFLEYNKCIYDILDKNEQLQQENQKYKEVIGKVLEYIEAQDNFVDYKDYDNKPLQELYDIIEILKEVEK